MTDENLVEQYQRDGFIIVRDLFSPDECEKLKIEAQRILHENPSASLTVYLHASVKSSMFRDFHRDPRLIEILKKLLPDGVMFLSDKIVVKTPEKTFPTPWHMDCFYWPETRPKLSVWIPFDDVTADNGALTVVPGSHLKEWTKATEALPNGEFLYQIADKDVEPEDVVTCEIKRGSVIIFPDRLVHGSTSNKNRTDRFTVISTYHAAAADEPFDLSFPARELIV